MYQLLCRQCQNLLTESTCRSWMQIEALASVWVFEAPGISLDKTFFFFFSFGVRGSGRKLGCKKYIGSYPALPLQGYQQAHPLNGEKHSSFCRATAHVFLTHLTSLASEYTWSITLHTSVTGSNFSVKFICVLSVPKIKVRSLGSWSSETVRGHISQICLLRTV